MGICMLDAYKDIQAIIFDLDNCLAPGKAVGNDFFDAVFNLWSDDRTSHLSEKDIENAVADFWVHPTDWVAKKYGFSEILIRATFRQLSKMGATSPIAGYSDLFLLAEFPQTLYLVTSGFKTLQQSKIQHLGIKNQFKQIFVDDVLATNRLGKKGLFKQIAQQGNYAPEHLLVVGDNPESELKAGKELGIITVQTLRHDVIEHPIADVHITGLDDLLTLLK